MNQQQEFHFPSTNSSYCVRFYRNEVLAAKTKPASFRECSTKRRSLIELLQRSPRCFTEWESDPRNTGWFGLNPNPQGATLYHVTIEQEQL